MKKKNCAPLVAWGFFALAACSQGAEGSNDATASESAGTTQASSTAATNGGSTSAQPSGQVHSGTGDVTQLSGSSVSISHGPVESIGWPAMTMTFKAGSPGMLEGLDVGDPVTFQFQEAGEQYVLSSIKKAQQ